jgi:hypothetical protein
LDMAGGMTSRDNSRCFYFRLTSPVMRRAAENIDGTKGRDRLTCRRYRQTKRVNLESTPISSGSDFSA